MACTVAPGAGDGESFGGTSTADASTGTSSDTGSSDASEDSTGATSDDPDDDDDDAAESTGESDGDDDGDTGEPEGQCLGLGGLEPQGEVYVADGGAANACVVEPAACESDPTGTWTWTDVCGPAPTGTLYDCKGGTETVSYAVGGTRSLAADGSYAESLTVTTTIALSLDVETCFGQDCAAFEGTLLSDWGPDATAACTDDGGTCDCDVVVESSWSVEGTWKADGSKLSIDYGGQVVEYDFCAGDQTLSLWSSIPVIDLTDEPCETAADCEAALGDAYESYECGVVDGEEPE